MIDIRPYASDDGDFWVVSDLTPNLDTVVNPMRPDFVLGVSAASTTLAQLTIRRPVGRALDLGTGCGVQSLHLAGHAEQVVATDLNPRAIMLARLTAHDQLGRGRSSARRSVRAGRRRAVRPDHQQPAVRDVPTDRRSADLPRGVAVR